MEIITCTPADMVTAFTEWERRYREEPERFMSEARRLLTQTPETYGEACAPYFLRLLREAGEASSDPRRRAMALGWTPPPPDTDGFWYHPEHGPVREDDLAGVLGREAGALSAGADVTAEGVSVEPHLMTTLPARAAPRGALDYITAGLARLRESAEAGGFDVEEVTLSFDEDQGRVLLKVSLGIEAESLDRAADDRACAERLARRLDGLLGPPRRPRAGDVDARASGGEQGLPGPVRRAGPS